MIPIELSISMCIQVDETLITMSGSVRKMDLKAPILGKQSERPYENETGMYRQRDSCAYPEERGTAMNQSDVIVRCPQCGTKNRIPAWKTGTKARCGRCRAPLPSELFTSSQARPVKVTDWNFRQEVLGYPGPVLVDFWAPWCGACSMVAPVLEELAGEFSGRVKIAKLNVDENPVMSSHYGIRSIPSLIFFKNGAMVNTVTGALPKEELRRRIQSVL